MSDDNTRLDEQRSYIAFISYRHLPLDRKAAIMLQRHIERYIVPRDYRDRTGGRQLGIVFRDEDELPLSSDLSGSIINALDHSEYLIVICTPDLPKSMWCEAEIRHFLGTHDRSRLLAVLVDGTPDVSFSPLMLHVFDGEGNIVQDIEPLAANIAGENHTINRRSVSKEFTRICAALIGCPFDALWQRARRARLARGLALLATGFAVLAMFLVMLFSKNRQIQSSLMANYINTAIRAERDGDTPAALAYYAAVLDADPGNADARLGAMIELQKYDWIYRESLADDALQALADGALRDDRSSRDTAFTHEGDMLSVICNGSVYRCDFTEEISPYIQFQDYTPPESTILGPKVCPLEFQGTVYIVVVYGGYVDIYRESGQTDDTDGARRCDLAYRIHLAELIDKKDPILRMDGEPGLYYSNDDWNWGNELCAVHTQRDHSLAVVQAGAGITLIDVVSGAISGPVETDSIFGDCPTRAFLSPDDTRLIIVYDPPNPTNEGEAGELCPMLYVFHLKYPTVYTGKATKKSRLVNGVLSPDGAGILWAEEKTISLLDGYTLDGVSAVTAFADPITDAAFDGLGRIIVWDKDDRASCYRAIRFTCPAGVAEAGAPADGPEASLPLRLPEDSAVLELLDTDGVLVDSLNLEPYFDNLFGLNLLTDYSTSTAYVMGYYQDRFLRVTLNGERSAIANVESIPIAAERFIERMDVYPGGALVAVDGGTVLKYAVGDTEPSGTMEIMEVGSFMDIRACGPRYMAVAVDEMDYDGKMNMQLWDYENGKYVTHLENSISTRQFYELRYSEDGVLSYECHQNDHQSGDWVLAERRWRLVGKQPDREAVRALQDLTSTALNPDQTLSAKSTLFSGLGNWNELFESEYPYEH